MIVSFASRDTRSLYSGETPARFRSIASMALRKLDMLDGAVSINDLRVPPGNHLEKLSGNRHGQYSIRINDQWRICFVWDNGQAKNVEIADYH